MRIVVYHSGFGCETGCCGHSIEVDGKRDGFEFAHPDMGEDYKMFAQGLVRERYGEAHVADLDWENSKVVED